MCAILAAIFDALHILSAFFDISNCFSTETDLPKEVSCLQL